MIAKKKGIATAVVCLLAGYIIGGASVSIVPQKSVAETSNTTIAQTYVSETVKIKNAPSIVCEITDSVTLESIKTAVANDNVRPSNVIVQINENVQMVDKAGNALGEFATFFNQTLSGNIIPVVRVETQAAADALVTFLNTTEILDMAVVSCTPALVKSVRTAKPTVRGIISCAQDVDLATLVKTANANLANIIVLPSALATIDNVRYLQARMKTVWVTAENHSKIILNDCIQSGAYGVVSADFNALYSAVESYGESLSRMPINVAYQSGKYFHNENSKLGAEKMLESGATAVHMNARLTKDEEIVFMYDETIERTSNGEGRVADYTKAELQQFVLDVAEDENEAIPAFSDVISVFKEENAVLWLELREESVAMFNALAKALKTHDCQEQVVVWASDTAVEAIRSEIPEVSTIIKRTAVDGQTVLDAAKYNSQVLYQISKNGESSTITVQNALRDRGIMTYFWGGNSSYGLSNGDGYDARAREGVIGFLGNYAPYYQGKDLRVTGKEEPRPTLVVGDKITVKVESYNLSTIEANAKVFAVEDKGDSFVVIAVYDGKLGLPMYTQSFMIPKGEATAGESAGTEDNKNNDADNTDEGEKSSKVWLFVVIASGAVAVGGVIVAFIMIKKRGENKDEE